MWTGPVTQEHRSQAPPSPSESCQHAVHPAGPRLRPCRRSARQGGARQPPAPRTRSAVLEALRKCMLPTSEEITHRRLHGGLPSPYLHTAAQQTLTPRALRAPRAELRAQLTPQLPATRQAQPSLAPRNGAPSLPPLRFPARISLVTLARGA